MKTTIGCLYITHHHLLHAVFAT